MKDVNIYLGNGIKGPQARDGWRNSHGTEVKNRDLWQQLTELLTGNKYEFHIKETHSYSGWIQSELERRKKNV